MFIGFFILLHILARQPIVDRLWANKFYETLIKPSDFGDKFNLLHNLYTKQALLKNMKTV